MNGDISIDLGSFAIYTIDKFFSLFAKDPISQSVIDFIDKQNKISFKDASFINCVGMERPIPIQNIYQTTRLKLSYYSNEANHYDLMDLLNKSESAIIKGGPGSGKTVLLNWIFIKLHSTNAYIPILFTLRYPDSVTNLCTFVDNILNLKSKKTKEKRLIILVDGYDEISIEERKFVSKALLDFSSLNIGCYYLTCRNFYEIIDLKTQHYYLAGFSKTDSITFADSFFEILGLKYDATRLVDELIDRGFLDFLSSPLMLTLICILKTGPLKEIPKNTIGIIRRALDTLTFRWDEQKGISRESSLPLDGDQRIRCLMDIAFHCGVIANENILIKITKDYLNKLQYKNVEPIKLLREIARWYGLFIPSDLDNWEFVHKTICDFLAARYWVESGLFSKSYEEDFENYDTRFAYAACLVPDATRFIELSLLDSKDINVLVECLNNNAPFDANRIVNAYLEFINRTNGYSYSKTSKKIKVSLNNNFYHLVSDSFLISLIDVSSTPYNSDETNFIQKNISRDVVYISALSELRNRNIKPVFRIKNDLVDYILQSRSNKEDVFKIKDFRYLFRDK